MDAGGCDPRLARFSELEPLIAHVDDHIALVEERKERGDGRLDWLASGHQQDDAARLLKAGHEGSQLSEGRHLEPALVLGGLARGLALGRIQVEAGDRPLELLRKVQSELRPCGSLEKGVNSEKNEMNE